MTTATKSKTVSKSKVAVEKAPREKAILTGSEVKLLTLMVKGPVTRNAIKAKTTIKSGLSKIIGAHTGEDINPTTLIGRGLVKVLVPEEGSQEHRYEATAAGKKLLAKVA